MKRYIALDVGTVKTAYCIIDCEYNILKFDKINNENVFEFIKKEFADGLIYEKFVSYGMTIGQTTIDSIEWNGRFKQRAIDMGFEEIVAMPRKDVKINLCGTMRAKDTNVRQALIDRFAKFDFKSGKGNKTNPDVFYGVTADCWSAIGIGVTYIDQLKELENGKRNKI